MKIVLESTLKEINERRGKEAPEKSSDPFNPPSPDNQLKQKPPVTKEGLEAYKTELRNTLKTMFQTTSSDEIIINIRE